MRGHEHTGVARRRSARDFAPAGAARAPGQPKDRATKVERGAGQRDQRGLRRDGVQRVSRVLPRRGPAHRLRHVPPRPGGSPRQRVLLPRIRQTPPRGPAERDGGGRAVAPLGRGPRELEAERRPLHGQLLHARADGPLRAPHQKRRARPERVRGRLGRLGRRLPLGRLARRAERVGGRPRLRLGGARALRRRARHGTLGAAADRRARRAPARLPSDRGARARAEGARPPRARRRDAGVSRAGQRLRRRAVPPRRRPPRKRDARVSWVG
mmetsp:Transcript_5333/g.15782  ORF Transcript_5333/g.15782 Transcript_5333/m.15782 type:complete len:269 (+) Transcript_5333:242-1048(+)